MSIFQNLNTGADKPMTTMQPVSNESENRWNRDEKEDFKTALDLIYEFKKKIDKLHPMTTHFIETIMGNK